MMMPNTDTVKGRSVAPLSADRPCPTPEGGPALIRDAVDAALFRIFARVARRRGCGLGELLARLGLGPGDGKEARP